MLNIMARTDTTEPAVESLTIQYRIFNDDV